MPLHYEFYEAIKNESLVADYVNSEKTRASSNSVATAFVRSFCNNDNFMHFDIAGTNEFKNIFVSPLILTLYYLLAGNK